MSYHDATVFVDVIEAVRNAEGHYEVAPELSADAPWPEKCACGFLFSSKDRQTFVATLYRRSDTGEETTIREAPAGAMWDAWWFPEDWKVEGQYLLVKCPNGSEWAIDSRASNCTMKEDWPNHRCWIRHGTPPNITVDKKGRTCKAGAGSIWAGDYHGHLENGQFREVLEK
jgi:hypothetical protein